MLITEVIQLDEGLLTFLRSLEKAKQAGRLPAGLVMRSEIFPPNLTVTRNTLDTWAVLPQRLSDLSQEEAEVINRLRQLATEIKFGNRISRRSAIREIKSAGYEVDLPDYSLTTYASRKAAKALNTLAGYVGQGYYVRWAGPDRAGLDFRSGNWAVHQGLYTYPLDSIWRHISHINVPGLKNLVIPGVRNVPYAYNSPKIYVYDNPTNSVANLNNLDLNDIQKAIKKTEAWSKEQGYASLGDLHILDDWISKTYANEKHKTILFYVQNLLRVNEKLRAKQPGKYKTPGAQFRRKALFEALQADVMQFRDFSGFDVAVFLNPSKAKLVDSVDISKVPTTDVAGYSIGVPTIPVKR